MGKDIYIYFDDASTDNPMLIGVLSSQQVRGHEVFSFEFVDLFSIMTRLIVHRHSPRCVI